jgi:c-di-GMP-binding flagellar brake protein YcgR
MAETDKIEDRGRWVVFEELRREKTYLRLHLAGKNFQRLTLVTGIRMEDGLPYFSIDYPNGFFQAAGESGNWKIHFELTGKDGLQYRFSTQGGKILEGDIWILFPDFIERLQRRRHFRLEVPHGTRIYLDTPQGRLQVHVQNVSLGGALGDAVGMEAWPRKAIRLKLGDTVENLELVFPPLSGHKRVCVASARVVRADTLTADRGLYGLQFVRLEKADEKRLLDLIYAYQREYLRKRLL